MTKKSSFIHNIAESGVAVTGQHPNNTPSVVDGMNLVHKIKWNQRFFQICIHKTVAMAQREWDASDNNEWIYFDTFRETPSTKLTESDESSIYAQIVRQVKILQDQS